MKVKRASALAVAVIAFGSVSGIAQAAQPTMLPAAGYKNCTAMNNGKYPHGVGKKGAVDKTSGKRVTNFTRSNKVYWLYSSSAGSRIRDLDRDNGWATVAD